MVSKYRQILIICNSLSWSIILMSMSTCTSYLTNVYASVVVSFFQLMKTYPSVLSRLGVLWCVDYVTV